MFISNLTHFRSKSLNLKLQYDFLYSLVFITRYYVYLNLTLSFNTFYNCSRCFKGMSQAMAFPPKHLQTSHSNSVQSIGVKKACTVLYKLLMWYTLQNFIFCKDINDPIAKHWPELYVLVQKYLINYGPCKFPN